MTLVSLKSRHILSKSSVNDILKVELDYCTIFHQPPTLYIYMVSSNASQPCLGWAFSGLVADKDRP